MEKLREEIEKIGFDVKYNFPLRNLTTFKIGGPAKFFIEVKNLSILCNILKLTKRYGIRVFIIGNGSNILINDDGFDGFVIKLSGEFIGVKMVDRSFIEAMGGTPIFYLLKKCMEFGCSNLEFLAAIPGTVGGAIVTNSGAWGKQISDFVEEVKLIDKNGKIFKKKRGEVAFSYRSCSLKGNIIISAMFKVTSSTKEEISKRINENMLKKLRTQPLDAHSAGCVFKNPPNFSAAELIERCGLKGFRIGDAVVSEKHANFILNLKNAKSGDVEKLISKIKEEVKRKFNITLQSEIEIIR